MNFIYMFILILSPFIVSSFKPKDVIDLSQCKKHKNITSEYLDKKITVNSLSISEVNKLCRKVNRFIDFKSGNCVEPIKSLKKEKQYNTQTSNQDNRYFTVGIITIILMDISLFRILYYRKNT
jgi:hypothetical protein